MRLNHLHLHVAELDAARDFYCRWFGFHEHVQHGSIVFLRDDGDLDLALAPDDGPHSMPAWFHFGFRVDSADQVEQLHDQMLEQHVVITKPFQAWDDLAAFRCADPDGYSIEVYWE